MSEIIKVLMERDKMSLKDAQKMLQDARRAVTQGEDPEEVLDDWFGLEPDYIMELV